MTHIKTWQERAQGSRDINVVMDAMEAEIVELREQLESQAGQGSGVQAEAAIRQALIKHLVGLDAGGEVAGNGADFSIPYASPAPSAAPSQDVREIDWTKGVIYKDGITYAALKDSAVAAQNNQT